MRRSRVRSSRQQKAKSFLCRKLADCIIAICGQRKSDWVNLESGVAGPEVTDRPQVAGACFDELGRETRTGKRIARGRAVRLIQTKPPHVRLNFRDGQGVLSSLLKMPPDDHSIRRHTSPYLLVHTSDAFSAARPWEFRPHGRVRIHSNQRSYKPPSVGSNF